MIGGRRGLKSRHSGSHPEGWARGSTTLKRFPARVLLHSVVSGPRFSVGMTILVLTLVLTLTPTVRLSAQGDVDRLALRFASMTAVTGLEQAMVDSLRALFPGSTRDHVGNVTLTLGQGSPKRLFTCPLDEVGYVVGNILPDGFLLLRRVGGGGAGRTASPLFDQQLEGHRVTVFGARGAVPGVGAVKSTHLARGRGAAGALRRHGGRDGNPRRCGPAGPGNPAMDGGAMRAVVAAAALLSVLPPYRLSAQDSTRIAEAQSVLAQLVETYGVSGAEGPVREAVKRLLPSWAKSETDTAGNVWVRVGQGSPVVVVIAHLDEIGFRVTGIRDDGTLELETRGGFISSLFEAKPALVHTDQGDIAGVFLPRDSGFTRHTPPPLRVDVGAGSRAKAMARGVSPGQTVTMPKQYVRLSGTRATGRSFDDRVGATAQLIALRRLDHAALKHQVIFIWSVREEIGLEGAAAAAAMLGTTPRRVHAIDTFVSADSPIELPNFAVAPIGRGAVARALDNSSITPPAYVDSLVQVARARGVALQVGTTNGGNDGSEFTPYGVVDVPIGWPLRYSHSPAEVIDLKDVVSLADMIRAVAETW